MNRHHKQWSALIGVTVLTLLVYSNTFQAEFHLDDFAKIKNNVYDHLDVVSWENLQRLFSQNRPIAHLSFAFNYYLNGLDVFGYHVVNFLIHLLCAIALYYFVLLTLTLPSLNLQWGSHAYRVAIVTTLLWAIHPVQTQTVTYLVQRMTELSSLFYLVSLISYIKARHSNGWIRLMWYAFLVLFISLAIGSKETAVTLPAFILLYEWCFLSNSFGAAVRKAAYGMILSGTIISSCVWWYFGNVQAGVTHVIPELFLKDYIPFEEQSYSFLEHTFTQMRVMVYYVSLLLFPHPTRLNLDYDFSVSHSLLDPWTTAPSLLFVVGSIAYACIIVKKRPLISFCILWFYGHLVMEQFILKLDLVFEHRLYLSSMGLLLLVSLGILLLSERTLNSSSAAQIAAQGLAVLSCIGLLCLWTYERNNVWQTERSLWEDVVAKSPNKARGYLNLGKAYQLGGMVDKAIMIYQRGLSRNPSTHYRAGMLINRGLLYMNMRKYPLAIADLEQAIQLDPGNFVSYYNAGVVYITMGQHDRALNMFERSRDLYSQHEWTHYYIGDIYEQHGDLERATAAYLRGIAALGDRSWKLRNKMAGVYEKSENYKAAESQYLLSLSENPKQPETHYRLGILYDKQNRLEDAVTEFKQVLKDDPGHLDARNNLGVAYATLGMMEMAIREFTSVLETQPDHRGARLNLERARQIMQKNRLQ